MDTGGMMYVFILARKNVSMKLLQVHSVEIQGVFFCHSIEIKFVNFGASITVILILSEGQNFTLEEFQSSKMDKIAKIKNQNLRNIQK